MNQSSVMQVRYGRVSKSEVEERGALSCKGVDVEVEVEIEEWGGSGSVGWEPQGGGQVGGPHDDLGTERMGIWRK